MTLDGALCSAGTDGSEHKLDSLVTEEKRILVIEDDTDIGELLALHLRDHYSTVQICRSGTDGLETAKQSNWDLILLDIRLPGMDGLEVCRQIRANEDYVPIIMLTSKSTELDHVLGLEMGADDYVTKPFSVIELLSRIKAIFRRIAIMGNRTAVVEDAISYGDIAIQVTKRQVEVRTKEIDLTAKEFDLLSHFVRHPGDVFSRAELLDQVWGYGHEGYEHTVNSHINRLRIKIEENPAEPRYIQTVWGVGYKLGEE